MVLPLSAFPEDKRREIEEAVRRDTPPPQWITFGTDRPIAQIPSRAWYEWHRARGLTPKWKRDALSSRLRRIVIERDGYVCGLCGGDVDSDDVHIDHILPVSLGGQDTPGNLQVTHSRCNILKGNRI